MSLFKNSLQSSSNPLTTYEVSSSFKIDNWHQLAMQQYLLLYQGTPQSKNLPNNHILPLHKYIKIYDGKRTIDFSDQKAVISLTRCILQVVFGVDWRLPVGNLCPRVPNRMNYLFWIDRYVIKEEKFWNMLTQKEQIVGVDVGTGANLIYPLIGNKIFGWKFITTQINPQSISHAQSLIKINNLQTHIRLIKPTSQTSLLLTTLSKTEAITFVMCNPPFFDSSNYQKEPLSAMTQSQHNIQGGQYEFFFSLYVESFQLPQVKVFTIMIGLGRNFEAIKRFLLQEYEYYGMLEAVRFGRINQAEKSRFVAAWKVKKS